MVSRHGNQKRKGCVQEHHPLYSRWVAMIARCENPNNHNYQRYGGRGIRVCRRWRSNFWNFVDDMGLPPKGHTLDRRDNNKGYSKQNCRWADHDTQNANKADNVSITHKGVTKTITEWAKFLGIDRRKIYSRLNIGWTPLEAIEKRPRVLRNKRIWLKKRTG